MTLHEMDHVGKDDLTGESPEHIITLEEIRAEAESIIDERIASLKEQPDDPEERDRAKELFLARAEAVLKLHGEGEEVNLIYQGHRGENTRNVVGIKRITPPVEVGSRTIQLGDSQLRAVDSHHYIREKGFLRVKDPNDPGLEDGGAIYVFGKEYRGPAADRGSFVSIERSNRASTDQIEKATTLVNLIEIELTNKMIEDQGVIQTSVNRAIVYLGSHNVGEPIPSGEREAPYKMMD